LNASVREQVRVNTRVEERVAQSDSGKRPPDSTATTRLPTSTMPKATDRIRATSIGAEVCRFPNICGTGAAIVGT